MVELPKTEAELDALITSKVEEATKELVSKHNGEMANLRTKHSAEIQKVKDQANLSAEEIAAQRIKEQQDADQQELAELRDFKKAKIVEERLAKEGLPSYFKNDVRLLNANESDLEKAVKEVKKEYEATLPKGNQTSTVVQTNTGGKPLTEKDKANAEFSQALKDLINR